MGAGKRQLEWLKSYTGVRRLAEMCPKVTEAVRLSEESVKTQSGIGYLNEGYNDALDRDVRVCLFCDPTFPPVESIMFLKCGDGTVIGKSVSGREASDYRVRDDVVWISEDFVLFPHVMGTGAQRFVLHACPFEPLNEIGARDAIVTIPSGSTDALLKDLYGVPNTRGIATIIVAFNLS